MSQICREIGVNRQQFNRYISGETLPSAYNLARIAGYFGMEAKSFRLRPEIFRDRFNQPGGNLSGDRVLNDGFPGDIDGLRRHLGFYQTYHRSMSWPDHVVCSCARLYERDGSVHVKSIERINDPENEIRQFSRYVGLAAFWRQRIFVVERTTGPQSMIAETILTPFGEHQRVYLKGITIGVSWRKENLPYSSRMIWRYLGRDVDYRILLRNCGILQADSRHLPPTVRKFLNAPLSECQTIPTM
ncbi:helix-turn-helix domain-containing protein [Paracoccus methylarcula]|uniref:helix-turn-helix domain-containing protein n=1 Tax=Paracoccus methylarcula TaxID=72022 RepID=UPI001B8787CB|nr:helix-turn-helix transcriptional regulator [Paracoccus methylarcula]